MSDPNPSDQELWQEHESQCSWALELQQHLKEFRPQLYKELKQAGELEKYCQKQANHAHQMERSLFHQGLSPHEARERARDTYIFPDPQPFRL